MSYFIELKLREGRSTVIKRYSLQKLEYDRAIRVFDAAQVVMSDILMEEIYTELQPEKGKAVSLKPYEKFNADNVIQVEAIVTDSEQGDSDKCD